MQATPSDMDITANTALANDMTNPQINWASMHSVPAHAPTTPLPARYDTETLSGLDIHSPKTHICMQQELIREPREPRQNGKKMISFRGDTAKLELAWTMNWVDRLRTSADNRMWSGRRAVVMVR